MSAPLGFNVGPRPVNARYLAHRSIKDYRASASALEKFFADLTLGEIHPGHINSYQNARAYGDNSVCVRGRWSKPCGANRIRKEVELLIRLLKGARLWGEDQKEDFVMVRKEESDSRRAMDSEEQHRWLETCSSREDWHFILWYSCLGLQTAASTDELRALQLGDVTLGSAGYEMIHIRWKQEGVKTKFRVRPVPLAGQAIWAMGKLVERARSLGSTQMHHYLFPFGSRGGYSYDPTKPMSDSGLKKRWNAAREQAGLPWLRPYDLRHTGITRMAEQGVPIEVAMSMVGHMTYQMHQHYTAIQKNVKRKWMDVAWGGGSVESALPPSKPPVREYQPSNGFAQKISRRA